MKNKVVIFLDIDGVLNNLQIMKDRAYIINELKGINSTNSSHIYSFLHGVLDWEACTNLNLILDYCKEREIDVDIVISSTWRFHYTVDEFNAIFKLNRIFGKVVGLTLSLPNHWREDEIYMYIVDNLYDNDTNYITIVIDDDIKDLEKFNINGQLVHTDTYAGLTYEDAKLAFKIIERDMQ